MTVENNKPSEYTKPITPGKVIKSETRERVSHTLDLEDVGQSIAVKDLQNNDMNIFAKELEELINSPQVKEQIFKFKTPYEREQFLGELINYTALHKDFYKIDDFMKLYANGEQENSIYAAKYQKNDFILHPNSKLSSNSEKNKVIKYIFDNLIDNGIVFHGFNNKFKESIKENGLSLKRNMHESDSRQRIQDLFLKIGIEMPFGALNFRDNSKLYVSNSAKVTPQYANASPEWFSTFVSLPKKYESDDFMNSDPYVYQKNDLTNAKNDMVKFLAKYDQITDGERLEILDFLEQNWKDFRHEDSSSPISSIALINSDGIVNKEGIKQIDSIEKFENLFGVNDMGNYIKQFLNIIYDPNASDIALEKDISSEKIAILDMPNMY